MTHSNGAIAWSKRLGAVTAAALILAATAGCDDDSYDDVDSLRDAYVDAGGVCRDFEKDQEPETDNEVGTCIDNYVLFYVFAKESEFEDIVEGMHASAAENDSSIRGDSAITGSNWMILNVDDADIADELDGRVEHFRGY